MWELEHRDFCKDLEFGEVHEAEVVEFLGKFSNIKQCIPVGKSQMGMDEDVDAILIYKNGTKQLAEIKTDSRAQITGNLAYEKYSCYRNGGAYTTPGCFARTAAPYIYYYVPAERAVHMLDVKRFREVVDYGERQGFKKLYSMGQSAKGFLYPVDKLYKYGVCKASWNIDTQERIDEYYRSGEYKQHLQKEALPGQELPVKEKSAVAPVVAAAEKIPEAPANNIISMQEYKNRITEDPVKPWVPKVAPLYEGLDEMEIDELEHLEYQYKQEQKREKERKRQLFAEHPELKIKEKAERERARKALPTYQKREKARIENMCEKMPGMRALMEKHAQERKASGLEH